MFQDTPSGIQEGSSLLVERALELLGTVNGAWGAAIVVCLGIGGFAAAFYKIALEESPRDRQDLIYLMALGGPLFVIYKKLVQYVLNNFDKLLSEKTIAVAPQRRHGVFGNRIPAPFFTFEALSFSAIICIFSPIFILGSFWIVGVDLGEVGTLLGLTEKLAKSQRIVLVFFSLVSAGCAFYFCYSIFALGKIPHFGHITCAFVAGILQFWLSQSFPGSRNFSGAVFMFAGAAGILVSIVSSNFRGVFAFLFIIMWIPILSSMTVERFQTLRELFSINLIRKEQAIELLLPVAFMAVALLALAGISNAIKKYTINETKNLKLIWVLIFILQYILASFLSKISAGITSIWVAYLLLWIPLANVFFLWISIGVTRALMRRSIEPGAMNPIFLAIVDVTIAMLLTFLSSILLNINLSVIGYILYETRATLSLNMVYLILSFGSGLDLELGAMIYVNVLLSMLPSAVNLLLAILALSCWVSISLRKMFNNLLSAREFSEKDRRASILFLSSMLGIQTSISIFVTITIMWGIFRSIFYGETVVMILIDLHAYLVVFFDFALDGLRSRHPTRLPWPAADGGTVW